MEKQRIKTGRQKKAEHSDLWPAIKKDQLSGMWQVAFFFLHWREGIVLFLLVTSGFLFISLYSYHLLDPGWGYPGLGDKAINYAGYVGAWCADVLFTLFGLLAWLMPVICLIKALQLILYRQEYLSTRWKSWLASGIGLLLGLCACTALLSLFGQDLAPELPSGSGGNIGMIIVTAFLPAFNEPGSALILGALAIAGFTLYSGISWFLLIDHIASVLKSGLMQGGYCLKYIIKWGGCCIYRLVKKSLCYFWRSFLRSVLKVIQVCTRKLTLGLRLLRKLVDITLCYIKRSKRMKIRPDMSEKMADNTLPSQRESPSDFQLELESFDNKKAFDNKKVNGEKSGVLLSGYDNEHRIQQGSGNKKPTVLLLDKPVVLAERMSPEEQEKNSRLLEEKLKDFGVEVCVTAVHLGPVITRFEILPAPGIKASRISGLASDLARSMAVVSVRVVEVIPGKSVMGIEIPNNNRDTVYFSDVVASTLYRRAESPLSLVLGQDISGEPVVVDLARMPHLLVAGTTGSGKSVGINAMLLSLLFKADPDQVRLIMIDPKMLELSVYEGIPHLLTPVVTDMKEAANALRWCVAEMERRYKLMAALGVRHISGFNQKLEDAFSAGHSLRDPFYESVSDSDDVPVLRALPFVVVVIDEFADMMMIVGKKVEELIARIAQKARAAGIHMILATQRPSVDVITGLIKANVPTRISFQVSSKIDSRTILDQAGAEQLLGQGDMLYLPPGTSVPVRVHGAFVSDDEVHRVVADWKQQGGPDYLEDLLNSDAGDTNASEIREDSEQDPLYDEAVAFVTTTRKASISSVQRKFKIGYNRAARIVETMEEAGVVSPMGSNGNREVLASSPPQQ
ncbi:DNA translocase FtsK [invertebrate metagenome]|uniref:DNA translocase FtsK n=1 Tax=invertebrate metagenome TaxID=1711999 RepID=A0A2H9TB82_9ZZZZ